MILDGRICDDGGSNCSGAGLGITALSGVDEHLPAYAQVRNWSTMRIAGRPVRPIVAPETAIEGHMIERPEKVRTSKLF